MSWLKASSRRNLTYFKVKEELKSDLGRIDKELAVVKWVSFATFALVGVTLARDLFGL